jgi:hypothetical protein
MAIVTILRELSRHRRLIACGWVLAVLAGLAITCTLSIPPKSRQYSQGVASARVLVDTPRSQIVEVSPRGTGTIGEQTLLLASVMVDGTIKAATASGAGIAPSQLTGINSAVTVPSASGPTPAPMPSGRDAYVLSTQVLTNAQGDDLPIIELSARGPTEQGAVRLVTASVASLRAYLNSKASSERVPDHSRLDVSALGLTQASTETRGPSALIGVVVGALVFLAYCACLLGGLRLRDAWRASTRDDEMEIEDLLDWPDVPVPDGSTNGSSERQPVGPRRSSAWTEPMKRSVPSDSEV